MDRALSDAENTIEGIQGGRIPASEEEIAAALTCVKRIGVRVLAIVSALEELSKTQVAAKEPRVHRGLTTSTSRISSISQGKFADGRVSAPREDAINRAPGRLQDSPFEENLRNFLNGKTDEPIVITTRMEANRAERILNETTSVDPEISEDVRVAIKRFRLVTSIQ